MVVMCQPKLIAKLQAMFNTGTPNETSNLFYLWNTKVQSIDRWLPLSCLVTTIFNYHSIKNGQEHLIWYTDFPIPSINLFQRLCVIVYLTQFICYNVVCLFAVLCVNVSILMLA